MNDPRMIFKMNRGSGELCVFGCVLVCVCAARRETSPPMIQKVASSDSQMMTHGIIIKNNKMKVFGDGGCRERIRDSARRLRVLREVLGGVPELILESPEVPLEPLGVIL